MAPTATMLLQDTCIVVDSHSETLPPAWSERWSSRSRSPSHLSLVPAPRRTEPLRLD